MAKKNLIVSLNAKEVGGEQDVFTMRTTPTDDTVIVEMAVPKVGISLSDLEILIKEIKDFNSSRPKKEEVKPVVCGVINSITYGDDEQV